MLALVVLFGTKFVSSIPMPPSEPVVILVMSGVYGAAARYLLFQGRFEPVRPARDGPRTPFAALEEADDEAAASR